jgi:HEAT repeat protein
MAEYGLVEQLLRADADRDSPLGDVIATLPVERLRMLLRCDIELPVEVGTWIAAELGPAANAVLPEIAALLDSPSGVMRLYAVEAVEASATANDGPAVAKAIRLVDDPDSAVRSAVLGFLAKGSPDVLVAAFPDGTSLGSLTRWLARFAAAASGDHDVLERVEDVLNRLASVDPRIRRFAAAAAVRLATYTWVPLERAATSTDPSVSAFAGGELRSAWRRLIRPAGTTVG